MLNEVAPATPYPLRPIMVVELPSAALIDCRVDDEPQRPAHVETVATEIVGQAVEQHLATCARCQGVRGRVEAERADLERALPFEQFASGVAARLAAAPARRRGGDPRA